MNSTPRYNRRSLPASTKANGACEFFRRLHDRVTADDREIFDESRRAVMTNIQQQLPIADPNLEMTFVDESFNESSSSIELSIKSIVFGRFQLACWYSSRYPLEYQRAPMLYICEYCLKYMKDSNIYQRHRERCSLTRPPGDEIYRSRDLSIFEVDGGIASIYCQNLCLLAQLFIDCKTLYIDVHHFAFFVLTRNDESGHHFIGYFSRKIVRTNNVSCIFTLPCYQNRGYGRFLIEFSYLLSRRENIAATPERPLTDLGRISYRNYWKLALLRYFHNVINLAQQPAISLHVISKSTGMMIDDIVEILQSLQMIEKKIDARGFILTINREMIEYEYAKRANRIEIDESKLIWNPPTSDDDSDSECTPHPIDNDDALHNSPRTV